MKYITAHTPATFPYPPYINVSRNDDMKGVRITVRSPANPDGSCGSVSFIHLSNAEYDKLFLDMESELKACLLALIPNPDRPDMQ